MPMVQAYAHELLNQKESLAYDTEAPYASDTLYTATERLLGALDRLEHNVQTRAVQQAEVVRQGEQAAETAHENEALRLERENLNATINQLEHDYSELQQVAGAIYKKLNTSIKRLSNIIGD